MISGAPTFTGYETDINDVMATYLLWPDAYCFPAMTRDGVSQLMKVKATHHKQARQCRSMPIMERSKRETPYQDYQRIKSMVLAKADLKGALTSSDLFVDACFPPDRSSLTYVYSGDDKYEQTVFKRPKEIHDTPSLIGVGGICDEPFPWQHWKQRAWFHAALVVVSLSVRALERLLPGFRRNEQNFDEDYLGCFHFHVWRFGEWVDIVVDDYLPMLNDIPLFCRPLGSGAELWGALLEKAYAKCKRTFQAIEHGFTLDALTDLTGSVCEFFTPDLDPPSNLFHILYKSSQSRSFMACWRNNKRLTPAAFNWADDQEGPDKDRYLHIITAVSKFSICGGRMEQMIRLKSPYSKEPRWQGRFSDGDSVSWAHVNSDFMTRLQPQIKKDDDEYWITFGDFRCNFGGLFIISSPEPFRLDGFNVSRTFRTHSDAGLSMGDVSWAELHRGRGRRSTAPHAGFHPEMFSRHRYNSDSVCPPNRFFSLVDTGSAPCSPQKMWGFAAHRSGSSGSYCSPDNGSYVRDSTGTNYNICDTSASADVSGFSNISCSPSVALKGKPVVTKRFRTKHSHSAGFTSSTESSCSQTDNDCIDIMKDQYIQQKQPQSQKLQQQTLHSDIAKSSSPQTTLSPTSSAHHKTFSTSCLPSPRRRKSFGEKLKEVHHQHPHTSSEDTSTGTQLLKRTTKANFMKKHSLDTSLSGIKLHSPGSPNTSHRNRSDTKPQPQDSIKSSFAASSSSSHQPPSSSPTSSSSAQRSATFRSNETKASNTSSTNTAHRPSWATPAFSQHVVESEPSSPVVSEKSEPGSQSPTLSLGHSSAVNYSTSDISVHVNTEDNTRIHSAATGSKVCIGNSITSLNSLTQSSFLATSADYFRSSGHWKLILEHRDFWSRDLPSSDRTRLDLHSRTQRVHFLVTRKDLRDPLVPPTLQERRHVLVSLLQDYRHGPSTANSLTVPIGFCLYKTKHFDRDEKRHISKLQLIGQVEGEADRREVTARFDLDPGGYFLVPFYKAEHHSGEFLLRVLTESDDGHTKSGCKIS